MRAKRSNQPEVGQWYVKTGTTWFELYYILSTANDLANYVTAKNLHVDVDQETYLWYENIIVSMVGWNMGGSELADGVDFEDAIKYLFEFSAEEL